MAHITEDRLLEYSNTTGTGDFTVVSPVPGYAALSSKLASGDTFHYLIQGVSGGALTGEYEYGLGTWNGPDFARTTPWGGSSATPVNFSAGTKQVALVILAPNTNTSADWRAALALGTLAQLSYPGGTTDFLRADGTWAAPPGGGGGAVWGSITGTLAAQTDLDSALSGKAPTVHTHAQSDVTGLVADLAGKAPTVHTHAQSDVTGLVADLAGKEPAFAAGTTGQYLRWDKTYGQVAYSQITGTPTLATVATTGAYADLTGKPTLGTVAALSYPGGTTTFLRADGTWASPAAASIPDEVGGKNLIENPTWLVNQRVAGNVTVDGGTPADRWKIYFSGVGISAARLAVAGSGSPAGIAGRITATSAGTPGTSGYMLVRQLVEGSRIQHLSWGNANAKPLTLSFWSRHTVTGTYPIHIANSGQTYTYIGQYTQATTGWEYHTVTIPGPTSGAWLVGVGQVGLLLDFTLMAGTSFQTATPNAWSTTSYLGFTGMTQGVATNGSLHDYTAIQLETGSTATAFREPPFDQSLLACKRWYQKSAPYGTAISAVDPGYSMRGLASSTSNLITMNPDFEVEMATTPNYREIYSSTSFTTGTVRSSTTGATLVASSISAGNTRQFPFLITFPGTLTANTLYDFNWVTEITPW